MDVRLRIYGHNDFARKLPFVLLTCIHEKLFLWMLHKPVWCRGMQHYPLKLMNIQALTDSGLTGSSRDMSNPQTS